MRKPQDPLEDLRLIGRGIRNLAGRAMGGVRQYVGARPNVQLTQLVKERFDALMDTNQYSEAQAKEMTIGLVRAALEEAIAAEKTAQSESAETPTGEETPPGAESGAGDNPPGDA